MAMDGEQYSRISRRMWRDEKFRKLSRSTASARELWLYLLSSPRSTPIPGLLAVGPMGLAEDLDWTVDETRPLLIELQDAGLIVCDFDAKLIWLPKALRHNPPANPNTVLGWFSHWRLLPEGSLRETAAEGIRGILFEIDSTPSEDGTAKGGGHLAEAFDVAIGKVALLSTKLRVGRPPKKHTKNRIKNRSEKGISNGSEKGSENQEQDQDQEQERNKPPTPAMSERTPGPLRGSGVLALDLPDDFAEAAGVDHDPAESPPLDDRPRPQRRDVATEVHDAYLVGWKRWVGKGAPPLLDARRRKLINARAKDFTPEQLVAAVRGAWAHKWHREDPAKRMSLDQIFANTERVEKHMANDTQAASGSAGADRSDQYAPLDGRVIERPLPQEEPITRREIPVPPLAALLARKSPPAPMPKLGPTGET